MRLDQAVLARGLAESRSRAQALIMAGLVLVDDRPVDKPGTLIRPTAALRVKGRDHPYVSRGGLKLAAALDAFPIEAKGRVALDIGASTGGFTDVLLRAGVARVYAVDVGRGQLAWSLQQDDRVVMLDGTNARHLTAAEIPEPPEMITCDASFIGLRTVLPAGLALAAPGCEVIALIKPQFEAGPARVGKGGVVRDAAVRAAICDEIQAWIDGLTGWRVHGLIESPIHGPEGNAEYLIWARRQREDAP